MPSKHRLAHGSMWAAAGAFVLGAMSVAAPAQTTILNVSYDVAREVYKEINPAFVGHWNAKTGETVTVNRSHGGSSKQALFGDFGLDGDVITMNQPAVYKR